MGEAQLLWGRRNRGEVSGAGLEAWIWWEMFPFSSPIGFGARVRPSGSGEDPRLAGSEIFPAVLF